MYLRYTVLVLRIIVPEPRQHLENRLGIVMVRMSTLVFLVLVTMTLTVTVMPLAPVVLRVRVLRGRVDETEREEHEHQRHEPPEHDADHRLVPTAADARRSLHRLARRQLRVLCRAAITRAIRLDLRAQEALARLAYRRHSARHARTKPMTLYMFIVLKKSI